jgi:hypothetical protein
MKYSATLLRAACRALYNQDFGLPTERRSG